MSASHLDMDKPATTTTPAAPTGPFGHRMERLRLRHLRLLDLIATQGSLSAAADALGVSQPGATKMLQEIEAAFGCELVERSVKGGRLTAAGLHTLDRLRVALQALGSARVALASRPDLPLVRLGILPLVGIEALSHVVGALQAEEGQLPRIQVLQSSVEGLWKALSEGRVDCAVGAMENLEQIGAFGKFRVTRLWEEPLVIVCAADHPLARRRKLSIQQIRDQDWVSMPMGSSNRRALEALFLREGLEPPAARIETDSFHIALSLVADSRLLASVPHSAYHQYRARLRLLPLPRAVDSRSLVFISLADVPLMPAVERVAQGFLHYAQTRTQGATPS